MKEKIKIAIDAMEFFKKILYNGIYRQYVGNFDTAISALEKQIPKKRADGWYGKNTECPICHIVASNKYCPNCGQALDWSDTE
jgi:hypothetical protein